MEMETRKELPTAIGVLSLLNDWAGSYRWEEYSVTETRFGYCCDSGNYSYEDETEMSSVYWTIVNFDNTINPSKYHAGHYFVAFYSEDRNGMPDKDAPFTVEILDLEGGESSNYGYRMCPRTD